MSLHLILYLSLHLSLLIFLKMFWENCWTFSQIFNFLNPIFDAISMNDARPPSLKHNI